MNGEDPSRYALAVLRRARRGGSVAIRIACLAQMSLNYGDLNLIVVSLLMCSTERVFSFRGRLLGSTNRFPGALCNALPAEGRVEKKVLLERKLQLLAVRKNDRDAG
jgi:hypothetical protein